MTWASNVVVVDTAELRAAAASVRRAADSSTEARHRLPAEVWGAPDWLASNAAAELGYIRGALDELRDELLAEAARLDLRADEVDNAEQRWAALANGTLVCGCVLPSGELVATPGSTAASGASGPGVTNAVIGAVGLAASGGATAAAGSGYGVLTIGGGGLGGDFTIIQPPLDTTAGAPGIMTIGGGASLTPSFTIVQPALSIPNATPGIVSMDMGGAPWGSAQANAAGDDMERRILGGGIAGSAPIGFDVVGYQSGMQTLTTAMINSSHYNMPGSGMDTYRDSTGALFNAFPYEERAIGASRV